MYLLGAGHEHFGPGTSMAQQINWTPQQERQMAQGFNGLAGCSCGGTCGHCGDGLGLFESGMDVSQWTWPEWTIAILGGYVVFSTLFTTQRAASKIGRLPGERRKRRAAALRKEASALSKRKGFFG